MSNKTTQLQHNKTKHNEDDQIISFILNFFIVLFCGKFVILTKIKYHHVSSFSEKNKSR